MIKTEKAKGGRPRMETKIPPDKVIKAYKVLGNSFRASKALGISTGTVTRMLKDQGIDPQGDDRRIKYLGPNHFSKFVEFVKWYKSPLPRNIKEITELANSLGWTDITKDMVKCYLYRRKNAFLNKLKALPDLRELNVFLEDFEGAKVPSQDIKSYKYRIDKFSLDVSIYAKLTDGRETLFELEDPSKFINTIISMESSLTKEEHGKRPRPQHIQGPL